MTEQELRNSFTKLLGGYGLSDEQISDLEIQTLALIKEAGYKSPEEVTAIYDSFLRSNSYTDSGSAEFLDK